MPILTEERGWAMSARAEESKKQPSDLLDQLDRQGGKRRIECPEN